MNEYNSNDLIEVGQTVNAALEKTRWLLISRSFREVFKMRENSENKPRGLYFPKALSERLIFGGAYLRREICVSN